jgi:hypothetical protein
LISGTGRNISLLHGVYGGSGTLPVFYPISTEVLSPDVRRPEREADVNLVPRLIIIIFMH